MSGAPAPEPPKETKTPDNGVRLCLYFNISVFNIFVFNIFVFL